MRPHDPLRRRPPELVWGVLSLVYEADEPVPWLALILSDLSERWEPKTIENVAYELCAFGALHRVGQPGTSRRPDSRALRPTPLGRAWLDREILPLHDQPYEEDP